MQFVRDLNVPALTLAVTARISSTYASAESLAVFTEAVEASVELV